MGSVADNVVKRQSGDALGLNSGLVGNLLGSKQNNAGDALALNSGTVGSVTGVTDGLLKRETIDTENLDISALLASLDAEQLDELIKQLGLSTLV